MASKTYWLESTASARRLNTITGCHLFKVEGYSFDKGMGIGNYVTSATFTIGGYDWAILYYPDGDTVASKDYLSCYLELKSEATNVKVAFSLSLLNHKKSSKLSLTSPIIFERKGSTWGFAKFIERKTFETSEYLKANSFAITCVLTVVQFSCLNSVKFDSVKVPASNLDQQLHYLLESGEGSDITFEVGGEFFKAHKLILGARSRVFHAHFFGEMKEKQAELIQLDNIEVKVFRILLGFIYSDSVSKLEETVSGSDIQEAAFMYQHLLVAADRFEVERLKLICEKNLSRNLEVENLATNLFLSSHMMPHYHTQFNFKR